MTDERHASQTSCLRPANGRSVIGLNYKRMQRRAQGMGNSCKTFHSSGLNVLLPQEAVAKCLTIR